MKVSNRRTELLKLFSETSGKTKIIEPMKNIHGTLRDNDAIERELSLIMKELIENQIIISKLKPMELAKLVTLYYIGKNDTEIARIIGNEQYSKTVARARVRLKLFRKSDFHFDKELLKTKLKDSKRYDDISAELGISTSALREYRHIIDYEEDKTIDPYIERIQNVMEDRDISEQMTRSATMDSLGDAIDITEAELIDVR